MSSKGSREHVNLISSNLKFNLNFLGWPYFVDIYRCSEHPEDDDSDFNPDEQAKQITEPLITVVDEDAAVNQSKDLLASQPVNRNSTKKHGQYQILCLTLIIFTIYLIFILVLKFIFLKKN
jgi:hypothetical protein